MAREEKEIHDLAGEDPPEEESGAGGAGGEEEEDFLNHLGYHNFYGF